MEGDVRSAPEADAATLARLVAESLHGRTVASAESCTAGRVATALAGVDGAADFLRGGLIAYHESVKRALLGVTASSIYSSECARQMAIGATCLLGTDAGVATTGVAGDEVVEGTPPGTVYIATVVDGRASAAVYRFAGRSEEICDQAARQALRDLLAALSPDR